jgi:hypothetical protein
LLITFLIAAVLVMVLIGVVGQMSGTPPRRGISPRDPLLWLTLVVVIAVTASRGYSALDGDPWDLAMLALWCILLAVMLVLIAKRYRD